jgi:hypothetical protein
MRSWFLVSYAMSLVFFLGSCASEKKVTHKKAEATGLAKYESDVSYQVREDGSVQVNSDKRSSLESVGDYSNVRQQGNSSFYTEGYSKKGWSQNKAYNAKSYQGGENGSKFRNTPHFAQQQASVQGQAANVAGQGYDTQSFYGGSQTVSRGQQQTRTRDAATQVQQESFVAPPIRSQAEAQGLSVDDTNFLLGR